MVELTSFVKKSLWHPRQPQGTPSDTECRPASQTDSGFQGTPSLLELDFDPILLLFVIYDFGVYFFP